MNSLGTSKYVEKARVEVIDSAFAYATNIHSALSALVDLLVILIDVAVASCAILKINIINVFRRDIRSWLRFIVRQIAL